MYQSLKILFAASLAVTTACDSNLQVKTGAAVDCASKPDDAACAKYKEDGENAPLSLTIVVAKQISNDPNFSAAWETGNEIDSAKGFNFYVAQDAACQNRAFSYEGLLEKEKKLDFLKDGEYFLCLYAVTKSGEEIAADNNGLPVTLDRTPPVVALVDSASHRTPFALQPVITDFLPTTARWEKATGPGEVNFTQIDNPLSTISMTAEGSYELKLVVTDAAGNATTKSVTISWDITGPAVEAGTPVFANAPKQVSPYADMTALNFFWEKVSGPGTVTFDNNAKRDPVISATAEGIYVLRFYAFDQLGNVSQDQLQFVWDVTPPVVDVGADFVAGLSTPIDASVTGEPALFQWTMETGLGTVTFSSPTTEDTNVSASANGVYTLRLTATDAAGNSAYDELELTWDNNIPTVNLGADRFVNAPFFVNATTSLGAYFTWTKVSGPGTVTFDTPTSEDTVVTASSEGTYIIRLLVENSSQSQSAFDELTFVWDTTAPTVNVGADKSSKDPVTVSATANDNLTLLTYTWSKVSGPGNLVFSNGNAAATSITPDQDGTYVIKLQVSDQAGNSAEDDLTYIYDATPPAFVSLQAVNAASDGYINAAEAGDADPAFDLNASGFATVGYTALLDDTTPVTCDGAKTYNQVTVPTVANFVADGVFAICVRLSDSFGNITYGKSQVVIRDTILPIVNAGPDRQSNTTITIDAATTGASGFTWTKISGPGAVTFGSAAAEDTTVSADADGTYVLRLQVVDSAGNSAFDDLTFTRDTQAPVFGTLAANGPASDGFVNASETTSTAAAYTLTASDYQLAAYTSFLDDTIPQTCNGTKTYSLTAVPAINDLPAVDHPYVVCVKLTDAVGNVTYGKSAVVVRDTTVPTVAVGSDRIANATVSVDATTSGATVYQWTKQAGAGVVTFSNEFGEDTNVTVNADGNYTLRLTATDAAGNSSFDELILTWDTTAPSFTSLNGTNEAADGYINSSEAASALALVTLTASGYTAANYTNPLDDSSPITCNGLLTYGNTSVPLISAVPAADKPYAVCVKLIDTAGNQTFGKSQVIIKDQTSPSVNVGADLNVNALANIDATVSGATTLSWSKTSGPGSVTFGSPAAADTDAMASVDGVYVLRLTATDDAGNTAFDELNFTWDTTAPVFTSLAPANEATDLYINAAEASSTSALYVLTATGYVTANFTAALDNTSPITCDAGKTYGLSSVPTINSLPGTDGPYVVCVRLTDGSNNITYGKSAVVTRDVTLPTVNVGLDVITNALFNLDASTGGATGFAWSKQAGAGTITFGSANAEDTTVTASADGTYTLRLTVTDSAGNSAFDELNFIWDTDGPTFTSLTGANQAADGYLHAGEIGSTSPMFTLTASSYSTVAYTAILDDTPSVTCDGSLTYGNATIPAISATPATDDSYAVCVKLTDAGNNVAYGKSQTIVRDATPPVLTSLAGANGASDGYINAGETGLTSQLFALVASGYTSVNYTTILDDSTPVTCDGSKTYSQGSLPAINTLPAVDKPYALCVRLADNAGNIIYGKSATITRDTVLPTVNVGGDVVTNTAVSLDATTSGATTYQWSKQAGSGTINFTNATAEDTSASASADAVYTLRLTVSDAAGNTAFDELTFTWDTAAPVFTSLVGANEASNGSINASEIGSTNPLLTLTASGYTSANYTTVFDDSIPVTCNVSRTYSQASIPLINTMPASDKPYAVCVKLQDAAGNITYGKSQVITRDATPPSVNVGSDLVVGSAYAINATTSGGSTYAWTKQSGTGTITFSTPTSEDTTVSASVDGVYVLRLTVTDAAGNSAFDELTFTWDTSGPSFISLAGANEGSDGYINASEVGTGNPLFVLTASSYTADDYTVILDDSTPVTCDASKTYSQPNIPLVSNLPLVDKPYAVCVRLTDGASNITYGKSQVIILDRVSPTVNVGLDVVTNGIYNIDASTTGGATYAWTKQSGTGVITFGSASAEDTSVQADTDGTFVLRLTVTDAAGNTAYDELNFVRDTAAPSFTSLLGANGASDGYINASEIGSAAALLALNATGYDTANYTAILDDSAAIACDASKTYGLSSIPAINTMPVSDKPYAVCVKLADTAGNITYGKSQQIVRDTVIPTVNVGLDVVTNATYSINASTTGATVYAWTKQSGGGTITFGSASAEDTTASASANGSYVLRLTVTDNAGNSAFDELNFDWDTTAPSFTSLLGANEAADGYLNAADVSSTAAIVALNASSYNTAAYTAILDNTPSVTCDGSQTYGNSSIPAINTTPASDDSYAICVKLTDTAGNITYGKSQTIVRDVVAPVFTSLLGANEAAGGYINASETAATNAIAALIASGHTTASYTAILDDTPAITCNSGQTYGGGSIPLINTMPATDDSYAVCVKLADAAGNITYGKSQTIVRDIVAPTVNVGADLNVNAAYAINATTSGAATFAWTKQSGSGTVTFGTASAEDTTASASADGTYVLRLTATDTAGNSAFDELTFVWDVTAPSFTSLVGANGASDGYINASEVGSALALLSLSASGHTIVAYTAVLDDTPAVTCDGTKTYSNGSIPLINTIPAADDAYAVCVRLTDGAGNITYGKSQQIVRDTSIPTVNVGSDVAANVLYNINATSSGASTYTWSKQTGTGTITFGSAAAEDTSVTASAEGAFTLRLTVTDAAGNSAYDELVFTWDVTPPTVNVGSDITTNASANINAVTAGGTTYAWTKQSGTGTITFGTPSAEDTTASASADGTFVLRLTVTDAAGNSAFDELTFVWDTAAPVFTSLNLANEGVGGYINASETSSTNPLFTLTASGQSSALYTNILDDNPAITCNGAQTYGNGAIPLINTMPAIDETYAVCVKLTDSAGNVTYGKSQQVVRDATVPTVNVGSDITTNTTANINATTGGASTYAWTKQSGSGTITFGTPSAEDTTAAASVDDTYVLRLTVTDAAGNSAFDELTLVKDTAPPTVNAGSDLTVKTATLINATTSGGSTYAWTKQSGTGTITFGTPSAEDSTASASAEGTYVLRLTVTDAAGNSAFDEINFTWDVTPPVFTSLVAANGAADGYLNATEIGSASAMYTLTGSGYTTADFTAVLDDNPAITCDAAKTYGNASVPAINATPAADDSYAVCVRLTDAAGNITYGKSQTVVRDATAPSFTSLVGANGAADGYINATESSSSSAIVTLTASGYTVDDFTAILDDTPAITCDGTKTYSNANAPAINTMAATEDTYAVCVKLADAAGNITYGKSSQIVRDTTPPVFTSLVGANQASDGYLNASETASTSPMFTLTASGHTVDDFTAVLDDTPAITCDAGKTYSNTNIPLINTTPATDESYAVCAKLTDAAGNVVYGKSQQIVRDTSLPSFTSMALANGATDTYINSSDITADLNLVAAPSGSGFTIVQYVVVASASTCSAQSYSSSTIPKAGSMSGFGDATYKVCVKLTDDAGNTPAYGNSSTITKDTTAPTVNVGSDQTQLAQFTITPTVSGATTYQWTVVAGTSANITFGTPTAASTTVSANEPMNYTLRLTATDGAGNSAYDEMVLTWQDGNHIAFMTSTTFGGNLGGLAGADASCQARATAAGLSGTYKALLSTSTVDAASRVTVVAPIMGTDGVKIADDQADLWDGTLDAAISHTEFGSFVNYYAFTGSTSAGLKVASYMCSDWTSTTGNAQHGITQSATSTWVAYANDWACASVGAHLYCLSSAPVSPFNASSGNSLGSVKLVFSLPSTVTGWNKIEVRRASGATAPADCSSGTLVYTWNSPFTANTKIVGNDSGTSGSYYSYRACVKDASSVVLKQYKKENVMASNTTTHTIFVTSTTYTGNLGGIAGADAYCAARATAAGLPETYKAVISTTASNASSRLTISGLVYNTVGVKIADNSTDFWDGSFDTYVYADEFGVTNSNYVWTGMNTNGTYINTRTCSDWTATGSSGAYGHAGSYSTSHLNAGNDSCTTAYSLYCISQ